MAPFHTLNLEITKKQHIASHTSPGVLEKHRDVMKEFLANHRASIRTLCSQEDDALCTCYQTKRNLNHIMLHGKMISCAQDFFPINSFGHPNDLSFQYGRLSDCSGKFVSQSITDISRAFHDDDIFYDCRSNDEGTRDCQEVDFGFRQLVAAKCNNDLAGGVNVSKNTLMAWYSRSSQSITASGGQLKLRVRSPSTDASTAVDHGRQVKACHCQKGGITMSPVKVQIEPIPQDSSEDNGTRLRDIVMPRTVKEHPQLKESQARSCTSKCLHEFAFSGKSNLEGHRVTDSLDSETDEEIIRNRRSVLNHSYLPSGGWPLKLVTSFHAGSHFTDHEMVPSVSASDCTIYMTKVVSSTFNEKVQCELSLHGMSESVIVKTRRNCRSNPPALVASGKDLYDHPTEFFHIRAPSHGTVLSWDESLEVKLTQQYPDGLLCSEDGLRKPPQSHLADDSREVLAVWPNACIHNGLLIELNIEHVGGSIQVLSGSLSRQVDNYGTGSRRRCANKTRAWDLTALSREEFTTSREIGGTSNDRLMRRERSRDMHRAISPCAVLSKYSFESLTISRPTLPPQSHRQNTFPSIILDKQQDFWSKVHDGPLSMTRNGSGAREQMDLSFPVVDSSIHPKIHSLLHVSRGARDKTRTSRSANSPHLVLSPRCLHATPLRTDFKEPFLRTRERAEIRRRSSHEGPSTPHRVRGTGLWLPHCSASHFATCALNPLSLSTNFRYAYNTRSPLRRQLDVAIYDTSSVPTHLIVCDVKLQVSSSPSEICRKKFLARAHCTIGPCDRCWTLATPTERTRFSRRGRSLFVARTRGGCDSECLMFPERNGISVRLCRRCFNATHTQVVESRRSLYHQS